MFVKFSLTRREQSKTGSVGMEFILCVLSVETDTWWLIWETDVFGARVDFKGLINGDMNVNGLSSLSPSSVRSESLPELCCCSWWERWRCRWPHLQAPPTHTHKQETLLMLLQLYSYFQFTSKTNLISFKWSSKIWVSSSFLFLILSSGSVSGSMWQCDLTVNWRVSEEHCVPALNDFDNGADAGCVNWFEKEGWEWVNVQPCLGLELSTTHSALFISSSHHHRIWILVVFWHKTHSIVLHLYFFP